MNPRKLFELEAAKLGHRILKFTDRGAKTVIQCGCGDYEVRVGTGLGDNLEHAAGPRWFDHVIDATFTATQP